jgi:hypothetical protein
MKNSDIGLLRAIALDDGASPSRRLQAIDKLAVASNTYNTARLCGNVYRSTAARSRRFIIKALRLLLKSPRLMACHSSAVRERLLCIRGIESKHFWRLKPGTVTQAPVLPKAPAASLSNNLDEKLQQLERDFHGGVNG